MARYFTQRGEWEHARERLLRDSISYRDINYDPLIAGGQMTLLDGDAKIAPGVEMRVTPGHNRDMCIVLRQVKGGNVLFLVRPDSYRCPLASKLGSGFRPLPVNHD